MPFWSSTPKEEEAPQPPNFDVATAQKSAALTMATNELKGMTKLFSNMADTCFDKCVTRFATSDLAVGELSCDDRCAIKYMETTTIVGEVIKAANAAQAAAMGQAPPS